MGEHHGTSRTLLRALQARETKCTDSIVQTDYGGVKHGTIDVAVTVAASSKNATAQIFPRQTPVENITAQLDLVDDTCKGVSCYLIVYEFDRL